jgi:2,5-diamino-6-(ribosylamino)-4(3H)-pyrimidinone 5'-phosphate reductase
LDGKIAGEGGKQLILSGRESMIMTHWMRTMHDAILVGIGTALNDDPQLNTRHLPPRPPIGGRYHLPRPVILDSYLRLSPTCKLLKNFQNGTGRRPWIICSSSAISTESSRRKELENAGAKIIELTEADGKISIPALLAKLRSLDIRSLMVEGGASIIGSFLAEASPLHSTHNNTNRSIVDTVIVTVAPTFVGDDGIGYGAGLRKEHIPKLQHIRTEVIGQDTVIAARLSL